MEPKRDSYDVVVIGAGMGGLTAAALLAKKGLSVLLVDKNDRPGGYAQSMEQEGFTFDLAVHQICGCNEGGTVRSVLKDLDVLGEIELIKPATFYRCIFPDFTIDVPTGLKQFVEAYAQRFPQERQGLAALVSTIEETYRQVRSMPGSVGSLDLLKWDFPISIHGPQHSRAPTAIYRVLRPSLLSTGSWRSQKQRGLSGPHSPATIKPSLQTSPDTSRVSRDNSIPACHRYPLII